MCRCSAQCASYLWQVSDMPLSRSSARSRWIAVRFWNTVWCSRLKEIHFQFFWNVTPCLVWSSHNTFTLSTAPIIYTVRGVHSLQAVLWTFRKSKFTRTCIILVCRHLVQYFSVHVTNMGDVLMSVCVSVSLLCAGLSLCLGFHEAQDGYLLNSALPEHYTSVSNGASMSDSPLVVLPTFVGGASWAELAKCF